MLYICTLPVHRQMPLRTDAARLQAPRPAFRPVGRH